MERIMVTVSYIDLLEKTANVLGFDSPVYAAVSSPRHRGYVRVSSKTGLTSYVFAGDDLASYDRSCEDAAKKAVLFFVRNKSVCIHDVNFERLTRLREGRGLYALKCFELECIEKGIVMHPLNVGGGEGSHDPSRNCVHIDYMRLLRRMTADAGVHVTPIECIRYGDEDFQTWFTIVDLGAVSGTCCIVGDRASSIDDAKQSLAQKATSMIVACCGIIVEDITSCLIPKEEAALKASIELYNSLKDRVYGFQEKMSPTATIIEQDQFTPRGNRFVISTPAGPPLPPKKKRATRKIPFEATVPHSVVVDALDALASASQDL